MTHFKLSCFNIDFFVNSQVGGSIKNGLFTERINLFCCHFTYKRTVLRHYQGNFSLECSEDWIRLMTRLVVEVQSRKKGPRACDQAPFQNTQKPELGPIQFRHPACKIKTKCFI